MCTQSHDAALIVATTVALAINETGSDSTLTHALLCVQAARDSANRNSTTKPGGGGRLPAGDGSNAANGHGSNNAHGASTTHLYASNGGSGEGSGSGEDSGSGRSGAGNGSGQGSGSGNEALAAAGRPSLCASPEVLCTQLAAAAKAVAAAASNADLLADGSPGVRSGSRCPGNGSNGNSGVDDNGGEAANAAKRETAAARETADAAALQGTAQGKHVPAVSAPKPDGLAAGGRRGSGSSPKAAATAAVAAGAGESPRASLFANGARAAEQAAPQVGFRAWVSRPQQSSGAADGGNAGVHGSNSGGLKRTASAALGRASSLSPPPARSVKARSSAAMPAPQATNGMTSRLSSADRFGSAGTGTFTGASDGTHFGGSGVLGASIGSRRGPSLPSHKVWCNVVVYLSVVAVV